MSITQNAKVIKHGTWALSNLVRGMPFPNLEQTIPAVPVVSKMIKTQYDRDILTDASWSLAYLTRTKDYIRRAIETGVIPNLVQNLTYNILVF